MNWANKLCDIIVDMNRLAKYFKEELMGVWVFIAYVISLDLSVYNLLYRFIVTLL
jgi:hypothetical protein